MNAEFSNHPFGDIYAERQGVCYMIGVKTRNKHQASGPLNPTYNVRKRGANVGLIAQRHNAVLAWVAIQTIPEEQTYSAYFANRGSRRAVFNSDAAAPHSRIRVFGEPSV
jgi:hypothetical protein